MFSIRKHEVSNKNNQSRNELASTSDASLPMQGTRSNGTSNVSNDQPLEDAQVQSDANVRRSTQRRVYFQPHICTPGKMLPIRRVYLSNHECIASRITS